MGLWFCHRCQEFNRDRTPCFRCGRLQGTFQRHFIQAAGKTDSARGILYNALIKEWSTPGH